MNQFKELKCEMLSTDCDALVITTNGFVTVTGNAVMGRGIAKQVSNLIPEIKQWLGNKLKKEGNHCHIYMHQNIFPIITFPVKSKIEIYNGNNVVEHAKHQYKIGDSVAGFHCKARLDIIENSLIELIKLTDLHPEWKRILVPRVGCGAGELQWNDVKPLCEKYLDGRFIICHK